MQNNKQNEENVPWKWQKPKLFYHLHAKHAHWKFISRKLCILWFFGWIFVPAELCPTIILCSYYITNNKPLSLVVNGTIFFETILNRNVLVNCYIYFKEDGHEWKTKTVSSVLLTTQFSAWNQLTLTGQLNISLNLILLSLIILFFWPI